MSEAPLIFDLAWGGYYTAKGEAGDWGIFRLLDFNNEAYHAALFSERFPDVPVLEDVAALQPTIGHAPIAAGQLLNFPPTLVGAKPLDADSLVGYGMYLEHAAGLPASEIETFMERLIGYSHQPHMRLELGLDDQGELTIREV